MDRLTEIHPDRLQAAIDVILPIYHKTSGYIPGHAQALAPTIHEAR